MVQRSFLTILSADIAASADWYRGLFGYITEFDSDWFVHLRDPENPSLELGLLDIAHDVSPMAQRDRPVGAMLTLVVDDVDAIEAQARLHGVEIVEPPTNLFYGQRRMLIRDPDGQLLDVSSECEPDPEWMATLS